MSIEYSLFEQVEIRLGTVLDAQPLPKARKPAYKLKIDFGEAGHLQSSAQITDRYTPAELVGRQVLAVTNLSARRVAGFKSECLVLGFYDAHGAVVLANADVPLPNGSRLL